MAHRDKVIEMLADGAVARSADLRRAGIPTVVLSRMVKSGEIELLSRGIYRVPDAGGDEVHVRIAEMAAALPGSVACLWSAARLHRLTDDMHSPWTVALRGTFAVAVGGKSARPNWRAVRWTAEDAYSRGVDRVALVGREVLVTSPSRTVADMVRPRNGVAREPALGAYAAFLSQGGDPNEVLAHAEALGFGPEIRDITPVANSLIQAGAFPDAGF